MPLEFFILCIVTVVCLMGISQVPLVADAVTLVIAGTTITATEIFAGLSMILLLFYTVLAIFTMRV